MQILYLNQNNKDGRYIKNLYRSYDLIYHMLNIVIAVNKTNQLSHYICKYFILIKTTRMGAISKTYIDHIKLNNTYIKQITREHARTPENVSLKACAMDG